MIVHQQNRNFILHALPPFPSPRTASLASRPLPASDTPASHQLIPPARASPPFRFHVGPSRVSLPCRDLQSPASIPVARRSIAPTLPSSPRADLRCSSSPAPRDTNARPLRSPPEIVRRLSDNVRPVLSVVPPSEYTNPMSPPVLLLPAAPDAAPARAPAP